METIVALSTVPGHSAIGVIRVSGPEALAIGGSLVGEGNFSLKPAEATLRRLKDRSNGNVLDQALLTFFPAPNSYTGENILEISCHGSPVILRRVIDIILMSGARLAEPGEFTLRALRNGKLNLSQAVAVRDLISSRTEAAAQQALRQLNGELSRRLQQTKDRLIEIIVALESALEFVEDDVPEVEKVSLGQHLFEITTGLAALADTFTVGHRLRNGLRVAIAGRPNVGKSSVFNRLVRSDRAIVSDIPGTTRDTVTESIVLHGIPISITDTAGVRESHDTIERMGVERSHQAIADADLVLVVVDGSEELTSDDIQLISGLAKVRHIIVRNKSDLPSFQTCESKFDAALAIINVSALLNSGLHELAAGIITSSGLKDSADSGLLITDARDHDLLRRAVCEIEKAELLFKQGTSEELVLVGLHSGLRTLGEITGETTSEEILSEIFSTFCIGK